MKREARLTGEIIIDSSSADALSACQENHKPLAQFLILPIEIFFLLDQEDMFTWGLERHWHNALART